MLRGEGGGGGGDGGVNRHMLSVGGDIGSGEGRGRETGRGWGQSRGHNRATADAACADRRRLAGGVAGGADTIHFHRASIGAAHRDRRRGAASCRPATTGGRSCAAATCAFGSSPHGRSSAWGALKGRGTRRRNLFFCRGRGRRRDHRVSHLSRAGRQV